MNENSSCCRIEIDDDLIERARELIEHNTSNINTKSKIFSLLGNEVRLKIIKLFLNYEKMCVCDLSDVLAMKQSPISQHLRKLKDGGLLFSKRDGMTIFYSIEPSMRDDLIKIVEG